MSKDVVLFSERLVYRPLDTSYCNDVYLGWMNDDEVTKYLEVFEPYTFDQLQEYLGNVEHRSDLLFWAIHIRDSDKHIGNIKIDPVNRYHGLGEYGIMMGDRTEWGKGYAREASRRIIDYCFQQEGLRKITLGVVEDNSAALNLYVSLGFEVEGLLKDQGLYGGMYCNAVRMAVFNPAYHGNDK